MARTGTAADVARRPAARILLIEGEVALAGVLRTKLVRHHFSVEVSASPRQALFAYKRLRPDLLLFDVDGMGKPGWGLVEEIRARDCVPILVISERSGQVDKVTALERGADDYVTKPLPMDELLARIRVALRRVRRPDQNAGPALCVGDLEIDVTRQRVTHAGRLVHLTRTEYALLRLFTQHADKLLTERMLLDHVWGPARRTSKHLLHVYIGRLRKKLEVDPGAPSYVVTEPGGYRFATEGWRR
jgi:two-component system KDP operon response regulator KdpE